jgi:hypothetical protein
VTVGRRRMGEDEASRTKVMFGCVDGSVAMEHDELQGGNNQLETASR